MPDMSFASLIRNEEFIQRIRVADRPGDILDELIREHPDDANSIISAIEFIQANMSEKKTLDAGDSDRILKNILEYAYVSKKKAARKIYMDVLWKAAIVVGILLLGGLISYYQMRESPLEKFAQSEVVDKDQGMIILSDGSQRLLEDNDSYIEYDSEAGEVIVKNAYQQEEKIKNPVSRDKEVLNQVVVPYGQTHTVSLCDGTTVQLNAGSQLIFPAVFEGSTREVYLKGEGYFEVHKNAQKPFLVKTEFIDVEVLGTTFNVSAYEDEQDVKTVLVEGSVKVSQKNKRFSNEEFIIDPGQGCFYSIATEKSVVQSVEVGNYIAWKDGMFIFKDMTLQDIAGRVKKYYNKTIQIEGEVLSKTLVSGKLVLSNDIQEVLQTLTLSVQGSCEITADGQLIISSPQGH